MFAEEVDRLIRQDIHNSLRDQKALVGSHQFEGLVEMESAKLAQALVAFFKEKENNSC